MKSITHTIRFKSWFSDFLNLMYPSLCLVCGENLLKTEHQLCLACLQKIPRTNYHLLKDNPVEQRFWGKVPTARATSYFYFRKGSPFQKILHELKYRNNQEIGEVLGKHAGVDLLESPDFCNIDLLVPVPLHPKKYRLRGYNQSECIARGLGLILGKPIDTKHLRRTRENTTQTRKNVYERYTNTEGIFELTDINSFAGKHILLIDDVLTTGSTLEACIQVLLQCPEVKVSVFTLAVA